MEFITLVVVAGGILFLLLVLYIFVRSRYKKAGPDEALIVFGRRKLLGRKVRSESGEVEGFRIIRGGGTFRPVSWMPKVWKAYSASLRGIGRAGGPCAS